MREAYFAHNKINVECSQHSSIIGEDDQAPSKQHSISITNLARETHFILMSPPLPALKDRDARSFSPLSA